MEVKSQTCQKWRCGMKSNFTEDRSLYFFLAPVPGTSTLPEALLFAVDLLHAITPVAGSSKWKAYLKFLYLAYISSCFLPILNNKVNDREKPSLTIILSKPRRSTWNEDYLLSPYKIIQKNLKKLLRLSTWT